MSVLTKSQFDLVYNQSGSGSFLDNSTQSIVEATMRQFAKDVEDSFFNLSDNKYSGAAGVYLNITDTTGLKAIVTVGVAVDFIIFFRDSSGNLNAYKLVSGTDAESLPTTVRPTDYAGGTNEKVWKIASTTSISGPFTVSANNRTIQFGVFQNPGAQRHPRFHSHTRELISPGLSTAFLQFGPSQILH